ncbi:DNA polymerase sliding clamp [Acidianus sp. RZ1]|uniref:DNA polymerase sliding clamp n=1 Tax=Acidianus sp. RZ1 TaxID=1540082 RepID=UPI001491EE65|nr:DNA polymerase sliding clamp [Acidianus sp. RZ1]NON61734.1 DNA polymerase sliding clamp [Acidianus sp. RZ1]
MKFKVIDAKALSTIFDVLSEFMDTVTIIVTKEGIKMGAIDSSRVAFIDIFLPSKYFEEFELTSDEHLGIKLSDVSAVLSRTTKEDSLIVETNEGKINFTLQGEFERSFSLPLINPEEQKSPTLNLQFPFKARILTSAFSDVMSIMEDMGEAVTFTSEGGKLYISVEGDMGTSKVELSTESGNLVDSQGSDASSTYSIYYITKISKMKSSSDILEVSFGSQIPIKLHYELPQEGYGDFYVAPRVE